MRAKEGRGGACYTRTRAEFGSASRRKATPTGGARLAVRVRHRRARDGPERKLGQLLGWAERREREGEGERSGQGQKQGKREKGFAFFLIEDQNKFNSNSISEKSNLNSITSNKTMQKQHECNTRRTTSFSFF